MNPPFKIQSRSQDRPITKNYTDFRHMGGAVAQVFPLECLGAIARRVALITPYFQQSLGDQFDQQYGVIYGGYDWWSYGILQATKLHLINNRWVSLSPTIDSFKTEARPPEAMIIVFPVSWTLSMRSQDHHSKEKTGSTLKTSVPCLKWL